MGKKMYYSEQEAAQALGVTPSALEGLVHENKLRVFQDGPRRMYRVDEVDALKTPAADEVELTPADSAVLGSKEVELMPADESGVGSGVGSGFDTAIGSGLGSGVESIGTGIASGLDEISLESAADTAATPKSKEDTVITAEGISIFDEEDLEIEAADPMAKTQIAPSLEDQVSIEGVGSGSGLLDLTRESDDTSLGAEVLDHIDVDQEGAGISSSEEGLLEPQPFEPTAAAASVAVEGPVVLEEIDKNAGAFTGLLVAAAVVALLLGATVLAGVKGLVPPYMEWLNENVTGVLIGAAVLALVCGAAGWFMGNAVAARQQAMRMRDMRS
ncbi:MAG: helix-turn-helix domain-containing protein [Planctomycetaceae bacterium]|nr:helix-turn-helix domain-containing protein [Planctomycetaceae bacterium]